MPFILTLPTNIYASRNYSLLQFLISSMIPFLLHLMIHLLNLVYSNNYQITVNSREKYIFSFNYFSYDSNNLGKFIRLRSIVSPLNKFSFSCTIRTQLIWYYWSFPSPSYWTWLRPSMWIILVLVSPVTIFFGSSSSCFPFRIFITFHV